MKYPARKYILLSGYYPVDLYYFEMLSQFSSNRTAAIIILLNGYEASEL